MRSSKLIAAVGLPLAGMRSSKLTVFGCAGAGDCCPAAAGAGSRNAAQGSSPPGGAAKHARSIPPRAVRRDAGNAPDLHLAAQEGVQHAGTSPTGGAAIGAVWYFVHGPSGAGGTRNFAHGSAAWARWYFVHGPSAGGVGGTKSSIEIGIR